MKTFTEQIFPCFSTDRPQCLQPVLGRVYSETDILAARVYVEAKRNGVKNRPGAVLVKEDPGTSLGVGSTPRSARVKMV